MMIVNKFKQLDYALLFSLCIVVSLYFIALENIKTIEDSNSIYAVNEDKIIKIFQEVEENSNNIFDSLDKIVE